MKRIQFSLSLIAVAVTGCSSDPPREIPLDMQAMAVEQESAETAEQFAALPKQAAAWGDGTGAPLEPAVAPQGASHRTSREEYEALIKLPGAESREVQFHLDSQTFDYAEDGHVIVSGPIASGKAASPTPKGRFAVLSKDKDKESSKYTNEVGTQAWMPYSMQFHGNYFVHEGWLPGHAASHGCIRMGHYHARLLFERMQIGDPVTVTN